VRIGDRLSKSGKQEDGIPQGAVSSPLLFILYVEAALQKILPQAEAAGVHVHMYADDLTVWKTGNDVGYLAESITDFLHSSLVPEFEKLNEILNPQKCVSFLFTTHRKDPWPCISIHNKIICSPTLPQNNSHKFSLRILGVHFDQQLTFSEHLRIIETTASTKLRLLSRMSNSIWGPSQANMITAYIAFVRSTLEYCAPVWYPALSKNQVERLERIQRKGLRIALGVKRCSCNNDILLESNMLPLEARFRQSTAMLAEKYRCFPQSDPLYTLAHQTLPPKRLKLRSSWQYVSDTVLMETGFDPSRNDAHGITRAHTNGLISLAPHTPYQSISQIDPWDLTDFDERIIANPQLSNITVQGNSPENVKRKAEEALTRYGKYDYSFWTDSSMSMNSHFSDGACVSHKNDQSVIQHI